MSEVIVELKAARAPVKTRASSKQFDIVEERGTAYIVPKAKSKLAEALYRVLCYVSSSQMTQKMQGYYPVAFLLFRIEQLTETFRDCDYDLSKEPFKSFFTALEDQAAVLKAEAQFRIKQGVALLQDLPFHFEVGTEIIHGRGADAIGGVVSSCEVGTASNGSQYVTLAYVTINNTDGQIRKKQFQGFIRDGGLVPLSSLDYRHISEKERAYLTVRGKRFAKFASGVSHAACSGMIGQPGWGTDRLFRADGRVMIDPYGLKNADPGLFRDISSAGGSIVADNEDYHDDCDDVPLDHSATQAILDSELWMCAPYVIGFSFRAKMWGKLKVNDLSDIKWRTDAFDKLVLPQEDKDVVHALVKYNAGGFTDLIDGKSGGTIFLLHGRPGQGKTLLAETVAEVLQRPLYTISVGELGINPDELEERLRGILDLAATWDAVLLLDEADIFLEARNEEDIVRNAMVGVFLRTLEYGSNCIFLTTNRVKNIDEAFYSRIAIAMQFDDADEAKLAAMWTNLLEAAGIEGIDSQDLAERHSDLNGRQIKNAIRLAGTLAKSQGKSVQLHHLEQTIELGTRFMRKLREE